MTGNGPSGPPKDGIVTVQVAHEMLARLASGWSEPVQIMLIPTLSPPYWEMVCRTMPLDWVQGKAPADQSTGAGSSTTQASC